VHTAQGHTDTPPHVIYMHCGVIYAKSKILCAPVPFSPSLLLSPPSYLRVASRLWTQGNDNGWSSWVGGLRDGAHSRWTLAWGHATMRRRVHVAYQLDARVRMRLLLVAPAQTICLPGVYTLFDFQAPGW